MQTLVTSEKQLSPAVRNARPFVHHPIGPAQQAQRVEIRRILRSTGAQAKLTIGQPNDKYEQEADRVADTVMAMPDPKLQRQPENEEDEEMLQTKPLADQITPLVQRQEEPPEEEEGEEPVQAKLKNGEMIQRMYPEREEATLQRQPEEEEKELQAKSNPGEIPSVTHHLESRINSMKEGGQPLNTEARSFFEPRFGHDFSRVRIHHGGQAANISRSINARAFTMGSNVVFSAGEYSSGSTSGRKLLAHELTHVVQQDNSSMIRRTPEERAALDARLSAKIAERERLRRRMEASQDQFATGVLRERSDEAYQRTHERLRSQAQSALQRTMLQRTLGHLQRAITVTLTGNTYVLRTNIEFSFAALSGDAAAQQAAIQIPRIAQTLRDAWRVDMQQGRYAGRRFQLQPVITHRPSTQTRSQDALQIIVRGNDSDPSSGDFLTGEISLANAHLQSNRIIVVAHELNHLFGDFDTYLIETTPTEELPAGRRRRHAVGRSDVSGRSDLLGMVDPVVLQRWLQAGEITQAEYDRQTTAPRIWQEDADNILYALGVTPVPENERPMPSPDSADYIEEANRRLEAQRRAAQQRLDRVRRRRARSVGSIEWVQMAERAMQLDAEIADLRRQISEL